MLIKYAGPPRALLAVLHGQKADSAKRHRRRDVGPLTESATLRHWPPPEADATAIATDWAIRPEVCYPALSRREASRLHRVPDGHPDEQLRPPGIRMPPPPAYRPNGVPMTAQRRALMSRAAANISRPSTCGGGPSGLAAAGLESTAGTSLRTRHRRCSEGGSLAHPTSSPQISLSRGSPYLKGLALSRKGGGKGSTLRFALPMN